MYEFIASYRHARTKMDMALESHRYPNREDDRPLGEIAVDASVWLARFEKEQQEKAQKFGATACEITLEQQIDAIETDDANFDDDELVAA